MNELPFKYTVKTSKRAQNIRIAIDEHGQVIVTKPWLIPMFVADNFVKARQAWIINSLSRLQTHTQSIETNIIYYKGRKFNYLYKNGTFKITFHFPNVTISSYSPASAIRQFEKILIKEAKEEISSELNKYAKRMQLKYNNVKFKDQKTRWGSCSSSSNLNFNWRLIMAPPEALTYVVIHELAHLVHMDHSRKFWELVEKYDPDYREHRRWLKKHQSFLQLSHIKSG